MPLIVRPTEFELSNGIPVILQPLEGAVAANYWWVRTGSCDEVGDEAGFAHFLEHMLFKDAAAKETGRASTGQTARRIESLGGDVNAYTSFDQTVYHVTCAAQHWEEILDSFAAMAKPQRFLKEDFEREREVILEELRKNEDSPERQLFQSLFSTSFTKHPYGRPVIGFRKTLEKATLPKLEAFYKRRYVSGNMGIILVGPVGDERDPRQIKLRKILEKRFGSSVIPRRPGHDVRRPVEAAKRPKMATATRAFDVKTPSLAMSFRVPDLLHSDIPALDLLGGIVGAGELSRLYQKLFYERSLVTEVGGGLYVPKDPGILYFEADLPSTQAIEPAAEAILGELARIRDEGPTEQELARVIVSAESEKLYATQTADGMAGRLGFMKFVIGDLSFDHTYLEELKAVDAAAMRRVAATYFEPSRLSWAAMVPLAEKKSFQWDGVGHKTGAILGVGSRKVAPARASKPTSRLPFERFETPSGIRVVHYERPQSQVFSVHAAVLGGVRLENDDEWGASHLLGMTWSKGCRGMDARGIATIVEGHAASLDGFSGRNTVGVQVTGLARDWEKLSELGARIFAEPTFPSDEVQHSKRVVEDSIRGIEDHSSQLCSKLFLETLYEKHPYRRLTIGTLESIAAVGSEKLLEMHRRWIAPKRMVVAVSGPVRRAALEAWLADLDARLAKRGAPQSSDPVITEEVGLKAPRWVERHLGREQAHVLIGGLGLTLDDPDRYAVKLMQNILGGQSGRLFIELREKRSLAYSVAPTGFDGMERGYQGVYIGCAPQKREEAIAGIKAVLEKLASKGPTPAEMARAAEYYLGRRAMDLQGDPSLASHLGLEELYRLEGIDDEIVAKRVRAVTARQIKDACRKLLVEAPLVTSAVC